MLGLGTDGGLGLLLGRRRSAGQGKDVRTRRRLLGSIRLLYGSLVFVIVRYPIARLLLAFWPEFYN